MTVQKAYKEEDVTSILWGKKLRGMTLREISAEYPGTNYGDISRALKGEFPKAIDRRMSMGLITMLPAPVCVKCGVVHTTKGCTANRKPSRKPRWVRMPGHAGGRWE